MTRNDFSAKEAFTLSQMKNMPYVMSCSCHVCMITFLLLFSTAREREIKNVKSPVTELLFISTFLLPSSRLYLYLTTIILHKLYVFSCPVILSSFLPPGGTLLSTQFHLSVLLIAVNVLYSTLG